MAGFRSGLMEAFGGFANGFLVIREYKSVLAAKMTLILKMVSVFTNLPCI